MSVNWVVGGQNTSSITQILYSTDGKTYTDSLNAATIFGSTAGSYIMGVAHNGSIWVAGGNPTNSAFSIGYSYDGILWYGSSSGNAILSSIGGVCYGNGKFVASGGGATYNSMYSTDGINWTAGNLLATTWSNYTQHVGFQNSTFVMCGGGGKIAFSSDGINWQLTSASGLNGETNMFDYNSGLWVVAGSGTGVNVSSTPSLTTSSTWTTRAGAVYSNRATGVKYGSDKFVLVGRPETYFYTSTNGTTWTQNTSSGSLFQNSQTNARNKIEWYNGLWIIGQYTFGGSSSVLWSNNGINWNASTVPASSYWVRGIGYALPSPYIIGSAPTITSITPNGQSNLNVYFTPGTGGNPAPTTYYYSLNAGSTYTNANSTTSPLLITGVNSGVNYNVAIIANNLAGNTVASNISVGFIPYPCFLQGSKILRMNPETDDEEYVPVESLRRGDLIRTANHGYKAVELIGKREIPAPLAIEKKSSRLYWFRKSKISGLREDLCVTGDHCILHKHISAAKKDQVLEYMGDIYVTEDHYRVPAFLDDRAEPYGDSATATIWHFALENPNIYHNYGVYANGLLVESSSLHFMYKYSNMLMI